MIGYRPLSKRDLAVMHHTAEKAKAYAIEIAETYAETFREHGSLDEARGIEAVIAYLEKADFAEAVHLQ